MSKIIIVDGNNEIELSTAPKENIKAYMVKGEPGTNGTSPSAVVTKVDDTTTLTVTDANGTTQSNIMDGYNPTITAEKENKVTTLTITDINGTATTEIYDGLDITGGVPTDGIIGFDGLVGDIPDGYEIVSDSIATQTDLNAKQDTLVSGTNIKTINSTSLLGSGDIAISGATINDSYSTSTTEAYSCNYINGIQDYSTTETVVGTWIDDKPIYRKILTNVTISLTNDAQDIPHGISNFSDLVDLKIKAKYSSTTFDLLSSGYIVRVTGTNINILKMAQGINLGSYVMTIIIEYTKTTN